MISDLWPSGDDQIYLAPLVALCDMSSTLTDIGISFFFLLKFRIGILIVLIELTHLENS